MTAPASFIQTYGLYIAIMTDQGTIGPVTLSCAGAPSVPTVTGISPTSGPNAGGTSVTISGTNFTGATAVMFGSTAASSFTVNSSTSITATTPAGVGAVDIAVTTAGGTSAASAADQFTYILAPTVSNISPNAGPTAGGTTVTITGANLSGATRVTFGGTVTSSYTVNSATQITATTPAHAAGNADVVVTTIGGTGGLAGGYTFLGAPVARDVSATVAQNSAANPINLSITGGTAISL